MMDHARHLSSPSPTSPFFFHHSERSSAADVTGVVVDDCFPTPENGVDHHHSFSRILLEEYSPLSLGEDCDNALSISPTSLACSSHHSFKSSLNGLKIDNMSMGDVHDDDQADRDDNDAHSMSPSLMSASVTNHHNLWSNSSTAITQNTSLLNSTSTSFLLSQHHQNQLNSLIQQLEPQSLDESPPLVSHSVGFDSSISLKVAHRPSSEPPPGLNISDSSEAENKSTSQQTSHVISKQQSSSSKQINTKYSSSTCSRSSKSKNKQVSPSKPPINANKNHNSNTGGAASVSINKKSVKSSDNTNSSNTIPIAQPQHEPAHSSKVHLQLNHHKKLQELQQRLFGVSSSQSNATNNGDNPTKLDQSHSQPAQDSNLVASHANSKLTSLEDSNIGVKDEPDSSANSSKNANTASASPKATKTETPTRTRSVRPSRSRRNRETSSETSAQSRVIGKGSNSASKQATSSKVVTTETAEPDTTTKSSDCIKLADLLSSTNSDCKGSAAVGLTVYGLNASTSSETSDSDNSSEKKIQQQHQIQFQVSPSLTVVANGNLMQQPNNNSNLTSCNSEGGGQMLAKHGTSSVVCNDRLKTFICSSEESKSNDTVGPGWVAQKNLSISQPVCNNINNSSTQTIGAHQIAIQVICQDGTSLVLPVTSSAGLNAAVSLTSQHQQLQAILANNSNSAQQQKLQQRGQNQSQMLQLLSVSNIVAQQQANFINNSGEAGSNNIQSLNSQQLQTSGLAASSPTLAALLDAGSLKTNTSHIATANYDLNNNAPNGNLIPSNLLKRLVGGNATEPKRGELIVQQGPTLSLSNCGSLVTVSTPNNGNTSKSNASNDNTGNSNPSRGSGNVRGVSSKATHQGEKRIKLATTDVNNLQTTFSLIDTQGLIVANGNEKLGASSKRGQQQQQGSPEAFSTGKSGQNASLPGSSLVQQSTPRSDVSDVASNKQSKMGSSTGNRQVDPTQPFRCEHCNSTFTRLGNFTRHKKIHAVVTKDGQRFKCDVCSKSFLQRCDLARHLHIHRGTEPHRCNICGKGYIRHSDLVTHQRFHNKEKPFGCPQCSKGFCQRGDLNRHLRSIHLQMKPILCPCCNRKFAKQETLLRHLNTAHRSKPSTSSTNSTTTDGSEIPSNYTITQVDDKLNTISVVTQNAAVSNNNQNNFAATIHGNTNNDSQKNAPVASLQAIQATICEAQQPSDDIPMVVSEIKAENQPVDEDRVAKADA